MNLDDLPSNNPPESSRVISPEEHKRGTTEALAPNTGAIKRAQTIKEKEGSSLVVDNKPKVERQKTVIPAPTVQTPVKSESKFISDKTDDKEDEEKKLDWKNLFLEEKIVGEPQNIPQSVIYELINETLNTDPQNLAIPKKEEKKQYDPRMIMSKNDPKEKKQNYAKDWLIYIAKIPLTHLQYITIPDPLSDLNKNFYPLSLLMSTLWIFIYSYVITWFTYDLSKKWLLMKMPFDEYKTKYEIDEFNPPKTEKNDEGIDVVAVPMYSLIPMFIYPIGISFRDSKRFEDFEKCMGVFRQELRDQQITLAETY